MPNRLNLPEDLEKLIEKRDSDRRQAEQAKAIDKQQEQDQAQSSPERRQGSGRRQEDRL